MSAVHAARVLVLPLLVLAAPVLAQRPAEEDLFGKPAPEKPAPAAEPAPPPAGKSEPAGAEPPHAEPPPAAEAERGGPPALDAEPGAEERLLSRLMRTEDPLKIGGVLYLRLNASARESTPPSQWTLTAPSLTDLFLDVRPTDRVRGFVLGRMLFDPTQVAGTVSPLPGVPLPSGQTLELSNPRVLLDQLWIRFDVEHTTFVTVGRQHVKWGVGRFWNPTDYLHAVRRDPLAVFDERTGTFMARVNVPWERRGWNFTGAAIFEPLVTQPINPFLSTIGGSTGTPGAGQVAATGGASSQLGQVGGAARAEVVLGSWELGVDGVVQRGIRPRYGVDVSGGIWDLDVRGELAIRTSSDLPLYRGTLSSAATYEPSGIRPMAVVGADWSHKYSDEDSFTTGLEYFYNSNGYEDTTLYPVLVVNNAFAPFYLGRHYVGAYLSLPKPGSWNLHTFTTSVLANLSDESAVVRLDWSMTLLTYLQLEAFAQGHFGTSTGEFRLGFDVPGVFFLGATIADVGLALRLNL